MKKVKKLKPRPVSSLSRNEAYKHYRSFRLSHVLHTKKSYEQYFKRWEKKKDNGADIILSALYDFFNLETNYFKPFGIVLPFKTETLIKIASEAFYPALKKGHERAWLGDLVRILIVFGCSRNQAIQALAEWHGLSHTTVRTAHEAILFSRVNYDPTLDLVCFMEPVSLFINKTKSKPFPTNSARHKKAFHAFKKIELTFGDKALRRDIEIYSKGGKTKMLREMHKNIKERIIHLNPELKLSSKRG